MPACRSSLAAFAASVLAAVVVFTGCGAGKPYRTIALTFDGQAPATLGAEPDELRVAQVVAQLIRDRLGLPFPDGTTVHVYVNQATFAEGLAREGGQVSAEAWDHARVATAVVSPRGLFLRGDIVNAMRLIDRVGLVAHELAHVCQMEMRRGGQGAPAQWIREGHADWVKYQVIDVLAMRTYAESRDEVTRAILRGTTPIRFFPPLNDIARRDGWTDATIRLGWSATYGQAFLAVDWLIDRYGVDRLNTFSRRFSADDADPRLHWSSVYPIAYQEFVSQFRARLEQLGGDGSEPPVFRAATPS
jgi:hypothetical protein